MNCGVDGNGVFFMPNQIAETILSVSANTQ